MPDPKLIPKLIPRQIARMNTRLRRGASVFVLRGTSPDESAGKHYRRRMQQEQKAPPPAAASQKNDVARLPPAGWFVAGNPVARLAGHRVRKVECTRFFPRPSVFTQTLA